MPAMKPGPRGVQAPAFSKLPHLRPRGRHSRLVLIVVATVALLALLSLPAAPSLSAGRLAPVAERADNLSHLRVLAHRALHERDGHRGELLATALRSWTAGPVPDEVVAFASAATPRDAAHAALASLKEDVSTMGVVDVGANKGYPVTSLGLQHRAAWVLAVEPDPRNFKTLEKLSSEAGTEYVPVRGAVSDSAGKQEMQFHKNRDDFTCFNCLNRERDEVFSETVSVHTVDGLVLEGGAGRELPGAVALLKTDTQGHEAQVLGGAEKLLASGRVRYAIMEFDPQLLRTKENALTAVRRLVAAGLQCVQLQLSKVTKEERAAAGNWPLFGRPVGRGTMEQFLAFVVERKRYTDLFCARRG